MKGWLQRRTLRFRLALWYSLGGSLLLALFSATVYLFVAHRVARPLDYNLRHDLAEIHARLSLTADRTLRWDGAAIAADAPWDDDEPWFELWDEKGTLVRRLWPLDEAGLTHAPTAPVRHRETISVFRVSPEMRLRVLSVPYATPASDQPWMLRVIRRHRPAAEALNSLLVIICISLPVVIALLVFGGYLITGHWLKPLEEKARAADKITAENLVTRLPVKNPYDELGRFTLAFNATLGRLENSFAALDRFVADASHELRTPLTALRNVGELALEKNLSPEAYRDVIGSMLEEGQRLQQLVDRLLELARADSGRQPLKRQHLRLDGLIGRSVANLMILAEEKGQSVVMNSGPCHAHTDPLLLRQAFQNIFENAIRHSPPGAKIEVTVKGATDTLLIMVSDNGPGIPEEHRRLITDRFFRGDSSRQRESGGFGLGLAITQSYMKVLGGNLAYEPVTPHGSRFILSLPNAQT